MFGFPYASPFAEVMDIPVYWNTTWSPGIYHPDPCSTFWSLLYAGNGAATSLTHKQSVREPGDGPLENI